MNTRQFYKNIQFELVDWAEGIAEIRTILVVGSQARQVKPADEYSDLDISLYVIGNHEQEAESYLQWMQEFVPVWMTLDEHHDETKAGSSSIKPALRSIFL